MAPKPLAVLPLSRGFRLSANQSRTAEIDENEIAHRRADVGWVAAECPSSGTGYLLPVSPAALSSPVEMGISFLRFCQLSDRSALSVPDVVGFRRTQLPQHDLPEALTV